MEILNTHILVACIVKIIQTDKMDICFFCFCLLFVAVPYKNNIYDPDCVCPSHVEPFLNNACVVFVDGS